MKEDQDNVLEETLRTLKSASVRTWIKTGIIVAVLFGALVVANVCFGFCIDC